MAITVSKDVNPIVVTGTTDADAEILAATMKIRVGHVRWFNATTAGHLFHLTDGEGNTVIKMRAATDNYTEHSELGVHFCGLRTDDLDSGEVYIYTR